MSNRLVYISMIISALFWSGAFIAGKMAAIAFMPLTLTFLRFLIALPFIFLLLWIRQREGFVPKREQIVPLIMLGIIGTLGYHFFFFLALRSTSAINSSLIGATNPMLTTILAVIFFKEKITPLRIAGVILSLLGVFSVITGLEPSVMRNLDLNIGDFYMTLGVLCFSTYAVLSRRYMEKYQISPLTTTAYTFLVCCVLSLGLSIWFEKPIDAIAVASSKVWLEIIYMAVLASVVGYYVQLNAIHQIGAPKTMMFVNLVPVYTLFLASLILGEEVGLFKIACAAVIICGVYLASRPEKKKIESNHLSTHSKPV